MITYKFEKEWKRVALFEDGWYWGYLFGIAKVKVKKNQVWFLTDYPDVRVVLHNIKASVTTQEGRS